MDELYRLKAESKKGPITLVLTQTQLIVEPSPQFRQSIMSELQEGRDGVNHDQAPRVIGWLVNKVINFAEGAVNRMFEPHSLNDVDYLVAQDHVNLTLGHMSMKLDDLKVDPEEALVFDFKFQAAKQALKGQ